MRIRAAVLEEFGAPLTIQELELADPKPGEALVSEAAWEAAGESHDDLEHRDLELKGRTETMRVAMPLTTSLCKSPKRMAEVERNDSFDRRRTSPTSNSFASGVIK